MVGKNVTTIIRNEACEAQKHRVGKCFCARDICFYGFLVNSFLIVLKQRNGNLQFSTSTWIFHIQIQGYEQDDTGFVLLDLKRSVKFETIMGKLVG